MPPRTRQGKVSIHIVNSRVESKTNEQGKYHFEHPHGSSNGQAQLVNLLLEQIQGLQQTQGELAETVKKHKEKALEAKIDRLQDEDHQEKPHQESSSHNK